MAAALSGGPWQPGAFSFYYTRTKGNPQAQECQAEAPAEPRLTPQIRKSGVAFTGHAAFFHQIALEPHGRFHPLSAGAAKGSLSIPHPS